MRRSERVRTMTGLWRMVVVVVVVLGNEKQSNPSFFWCLDLGNAQPKF